MSFIDSGQGEKLFTQFLAQYKGGSARVYRSEICQFFAFMGGGLDGVTTKVSPPIFS